MLVIIFKNGLDSGAVALIMFNTEHSSLSVFFSPVRLVDNQSKPAGTKPSGFVHVAIESIFNCNLCIYLNSNV